MCAIYRMTIFFWIFIFLTLLVSLCLDNHERGIDRGNNFSEQAAVSYSVTHTHTPHIWHHVVWKQCQQHSCGKFFSECFVVLAIENTNATIHNVRSTWSLYICRIGNYRNLKIKNSLVFTLKVQVLTKMPNVPLKFN